MRANFDSNGVGRAHVASVAGTPTGCALITVGRAERTNTIVIVAGANGAMTPRDVVAARTAIERCDVLLCQMEIPAAARRLGVLMNESLDLEESADSTLFTRSGFFRGNNVSREFSRTSRIRSVAFPGTRSVSNRSATEDTRPTTVSTRNYGTLRAQFGLGTVQPTRDGHVSFQNTLDRPKPRHSSHPLSNTDGVASIAGDARGALALPRRPASNDSIWFESG